MIIKLYSDDGLLLDRLTPADFSGNDHDTPGWRGLTHDIRMAMLREARLRGEGQDAGRAERAEAEIQRLKETLRGAAGILRLEASLSTGRSKSALLGAAEELTRAAEES